MSSFVESTEISNTRAHLLFTLQLGPQYRVMVKEVEVIQRSGETRSGSKNYGSRRYRPLFEAKSIPSD